ncbi:Glycoside hydrolase [Theobroma cacao]|nr:Glycoside hydrolase [Theobroma cacao]
MAVELNVLALSLLFLLASNAKAQPNNGVFDVMNFGAKAGGKTDISQALMAAWREACALVSPSKVVIPEGEYMLSQVTLAGPCKAPVEVQVRGNLKAPADPSKFNNVPSWVTFQRIDHFTLSGAGTFDGQGGYAAWAQNDCKQSKKCNKLPINIRFNFVTNGLVRDITSVDSKQFHINLLGCKNLTFANITINAPDQSPNTDGIHIGRSSGIDITDSRISTEYCPSNKCNLKAPSRVKISNVSFKNIRGTSATQVAVKLACSSGIPCENVEIGDINLSYIGTEGPATSLCSNVKPTIAGRQTPLACGLIV